MTAQFRNLGAFIQAQTSVQPQVLSGGSPVNGASFNRQGFQSCVLKVSNGAAAGAPTSYSVAGKLQHSTDNSTWSDLAGASITALAADNGHAYVNVDLSGAHQYVRAVLTPSFTGGTSPSVTAEATIVLGGADTLPTASY